MLNKLIEVEFTDQLWDYYVDNIAGGYVFYKTAYLNAFCADSLDKPVMLLYDNTNEKALCVCIKRDISNSKFFEGKLSMGKYYDLISPYGYGGYVGTVERKDVLMKEHHDYCVSKNYVCEVVKVHPLSEFYSLYQGRLDTTFHNVVCDLTLPADDIWKGFKPKVRKNVKHALDNSLEVVIDYEGEYLDDFLRIYYSTMDRNNADKNFYFGKDFFKSIISMKDQCVFFHVFNGGSVIATELVLYDDYYCYSYLGGTDREYYNLRPNDLLKYEIINWGRKKGLHCFVLGGGHGSDDGIFQYKAAFAPYGIYDFYVGTDIFAEDTYNYLCKMRKEMDLDFETETRLVPAYRF